jgi:hypothetical protein
VRWRYFNNNPFEIPPTPPTSPLKNRSRICIIMPPVFESRREIPD